MTNQPTPGWVYVLTHPTWQKLGMVKIGRTGRDPRTRAAEIASVSGLLAPCTVVVCSPVSDMAAAEKAVHRMLGTQRVKKRRELFRVDTATAQQVVEAVARSLPLQASPVPIAARSASFGQPKASKLCQQRRCPPARRYGRRRPSMSARLAVGLVALVVIVVLFNLH